MNESALIIADFFHILEGDIQNIDYQYFDFEKLYRQAGKSENKTLYCIRTSYPTVLFKEILQKMTVIKAAGGLVKNKAGNYLFIKRLGKWDLPKGKVEKGEKMKDAAKREVEEECGIHIHALGPKVGSTFHAYMLNGKPVIKKTNWYKMEVSDVPKLTPQLIEDITQARWLESSELSLVRENTYPLIKELIKTF